MAPPEQPANLDPLFRFLDWDLEVDPELFEYIRSAYLGESKQADIHCAELHFYNNFNLLRVTFPMDSSEAQSDAKPRRGYALYWLDKKNESQKRNEPQKIVPLDGTSLPIHETNREDNLTLSDNTEDSKRAVDEYLRFFCSAVHAEDGPFLILDENNYTQVVSLEDNESVRSTLKEAWQFGIQSEANPELKDEFAKLSNPFPGSSIKRRRACVIYSSALFQAWFAMDNSTENPGMVEMLDDEPILAGLKVNIPRYRDRSLVVLRGLAREDRVSISLPEPTHDRVHRMPPDTEPTKAEDAGAALPAPKEYRSFSRSKPDHYYSRRGQSADERTKVDELLATLTRSDAPLGDTIEVELVFSTTGQRRRTKE